MGIHCKTCDARVSGSNSRYYGGLATSMMAERDGWRKTVIGSWVCPKCQGCPTETPAPAEDPMEQVRILNRLDVAIRTLKEVRDLIEGGTK